MTLAATPAELESPTSGAAALEGLTARYADRSSALRRALERRERVVGCVGNVIPIELILAAGLRPLQVVPELSHPTPIGDEFIEDTVPWGTRSVFERVLDGSYSQLELLVLDRSQTDLYYYLKEIVRIGRGRRVPPLYAFDMIQQLDAPVQRYNEERTRHLADHLARCASSPFTEASLAESIAVTNDIRALQRRVLTLRQSAILSGVDALQVLGAGYLMATHEYASALRALIADPPPVRAANRPRVAVLSSERLSHTSLHEVLEGEGALVISEGDWWGSAGVGGDVDPCAPPLEAITRKYFADTVSPELAPGAARNRWILEEVSSDRRPDGVVFYIPPTDRSYGWDYPLLRDELAGLDIPSCIIRADVLHVEGRELAGTEAHTFVDSLSQD